MSKPTELELKTLDTIREEITEVIEELSENNLRLVILKKMVEKLEVKFTELILKESEFITELNEKYGNEGFNIDSE